MDGPKASSFGHSATSYANLNSLESAPFVETTLAPTDSDDLDSILVASGESLDYSLELDDPPCLDFTSPPLNGDLDFNGVISSPSFDFFNDEHVFMACNAYHFDHPLPDNSDGPYLVDDDLINTKYNTFGGSEWQEVLMDCVVNHTVLDEYKQYAVNNLEIQ